jgi:hypothetical protein
MTLEGVEAVAVGIAALVSSPQLRTLTWAAVIRLGHIALKSPQQSLLR